jgi:capsular exopolysaccharide synthesis family protein
MGHIERALAQARERERAAAAQGQSAAPATLPARPAPPRHGGPVTLDIASSRRIELDPAVLEKNRVIAGRQRSSGTEAFKMLRTRIRRIMESQGLVTLAVSSATPADGKTLVSVNLAFTMAAETTGEVVLVDFDLRNPSVGEILELDPSLPGIASYLNGDAKLQDISLCPQDRLAIIVNREVFPHSSEVLSSPRVAELVAELRASNVPRVVIFDLPPLLHVADFLAFSPHVDAMLMVACEGKTKREDLSEAIDLLAGVNVLGTVLNKSVSRSEGYYTYY